MSADRSPRPLSASLLLGVLALPLIFVWFLLRSGYSDTLRTGAFLYLGMTVAIGVANMRGM